MANHASSAQSDSEKEEWLPVVGWEGLYEVSDLGRVRSLDRVVSSTDARGRSYNRQYRGRILKLGLNTHGRAVVLLSSKERGQTTCTVAVMVCTAFHGEGALGHEVAHNDGNRRNDRADNLRWATRSENQMDRVGHGTSNRGERHGNSKLTAEIVRLIKKSSQSHAELGRCYGVNYRTIFDIRNGRIWGHVK